MIAILLIAIIAILLIAIIAVVRGPRRDVALELPHADGTGVNNFQGLHPDSQQVPCDGNRGYTQSMSSHLMSYHIMSCHLVSCHVMSCHVM